MKKIYTENGLIAYKSNIIENMKLGGVGICDHCNKRAFEGYLVPVLNHYLCEKCYKEFSGSAERFPEDVPIEAKRANYYETVIGLEE